MPVSGKIHPLADGKNTCLAVQRQVQLYSQKVTDRVVDAPERHLVVVQDDKIIHVAQIKFQAKALFGVVVQHVQIGVGEKLTCEAAQGEPALLKTAVQNQPVEQPVHVPIADGALQYLKQNPVIDAGEVLRYVRLQRVNTAPLPLGGGKLSAQTQAGGQRTLAHTAGKALGQKPPLKWRADMLHQGVVHHPVGKLRGIYHPPFGFVDDESTEWAWSPYFVQHPVLNIEQIFFQGGVEPQGVGLVALEA